MDIEILKSYFKQRLQQRLPGYEAHKLMLPQGRNYFEKPENPKLAAVTFLFFPYKEVVKFVLVKRIVDNTAHSGQISLPGGQKDPTDKNLLYTAKRETFEEIGVNIPEENFLGELSKLYIPVSNFVVYPFVAYYDTEPVFIISEDEIEVLITPDMFEFFASPVVWQHFTTGISQKQRIYAPAYNYNGILVWGATAMILSEIKFLLKKFLVNYE